MTTFFIFHIMESSIIVSILFLELLDQVDSIGTDFLKEPTPESWTFLTNRLKILEKAAEKTLEKVLFKLGVGTNHIGTPTLTMKQQTIIQFLTSEKAILTCLAEATATAKQLYTEDQQHF